MTVDTAIADRSLGIAVYRKGEECEEETEEPGSPEPSVIQIIPERRQSMYKIYLELEGNDDSPINDIKCSPEAYSL